MSERSPRAGIVCLIGSGELSPAMVSLHADLMRRVEAPPGVAVLLDTTYGFQDNADALSKKIRRYFATRVGVSVEVASLREMDAEDPLSMERAYQKLREAPYVFAGPGSPSYALRQWRRSLVPGLLADRLAQGSCVCFASAAAITIGRLALPVYEIYKVGEAGHWIEGLDLLESFGLDLAVVPHYDNTEGGSHDTRFCYIGERRFKQLERQLPPGVGIFGIAENTAAIFDLGADTLEVRGRGFVAFRRGGDEHRFEPGTVVPLDGLRSAADARMSSLTAQLRGDTLPAAGAEIERLQAHFASAVQNGAFEDAVRALLRLDAWLVNAPDRGLAPQAAELARATYRRMLVELGEAAQQRSVAREPLTEIVDIAVRLREKARGDRRYSEADRLRDALLDLGVEIRDTGMGPRWSSNSPD